MAVYVDDAMIPFGRMKMSHLFADTPEELFAMVDAIGVQRKWFQNKSAPHFDVCASKREKAIEAGAIELEYGTNDGWMEVYQRLKKKFAAPESRVLFLEMAHAKS